MTENPGVQHPGPRGGPLFSSKQILRLTIGLLIAYASILCMGLAGKLFSVQWILDLPFFKI